MMTPTYTNRIKPILGKQEMKCKGITVASFLCPLPHPIAQYTPDLYPGSSLFNFFSEQLNKKEGKGDITITMVALH